MYILSKKDKLFNVKVNSFDGGIFQAYIENESGELMGEITFKVSKDRTWIYNIATEERFQYQGIGQALLDICEYISAKKCVYIVEGKFYPRNDYAKNFYEKNGYSIDREDYFTEIYKLLNRELTFKRLKNRIFKSGEELANSLR